jgi:predicted Zn-dependent peptidase
LSQRFYKHVLANGLTLVAEQMPGMQSAAMTLLLPAGASTDPPSRRGAATVLAELVLRGAGNRDSRQLTEYLDGLGLQRSSSVGIYHSRLGAAAPAARVMEGLGAYADIVLHPQLPESGFAPARELALQALEGIEDEPRQKLIIKLREVYLKAPLGRNPLGVKEDLNALTLADCRQEHANRYHPRGAILAVAGKIEFAELTSAVEQHFGGWNGAAIPDAKADGAISRYAFEHHKSEQTHIGIAYPSIAETDERYYIVRLALEVLSGGTSSRLFTEVREKRSLCYSVWAGYSSLKGEGHVFGYAGTSNDRAQATLDCFLHELDRFSEGITAEELTRAKIGLKADTIMSSESTSSRAGAIAHDQFMLGRIRSIDDIKAAIDGVTLEQVNDYLKKNKPGPFTIVIVGPRELNLPAEG